MNTNSDGTYLLKNRLNTKAFNIIFSWIKEYEIEVIFSKPRKSKLGDYRSPRKGKGHRITINKDLNPYAFIITLTHEIAHLITWVKHKHRVKPHGSEWKTEFQALMEKLAPLKLFPANVENALTQYLSNPSASSCNDYHLYKTLMLFDSRDTSLCAVEEITEKALFKTSSGRIFRKETKLRKRYKCMEINTRKIYLFNPLALVSKI